MIALCLRSQDSVPRRSTVVGQRTPSTPTASFPLDEAGVMPAEMGEGYPCLLLKHILQIISIDFLSDMTSWLAILLHFYISYFY